MMNAKSLKLKKYKCFKQFRRSQSLDDLALYKANRNEFKDLCDRKQETFRNKFDSHTKTMNAPKSISKKVKHLVKNICSNRNNISNDEWKSYFESFYHKR